MIVPPCPWALIFRPAPWEGFIGVFSFDPHRKPRMGEVGICVWHKGRGSERWSDSLETLIRTAHPGLSDPETHTVLPSFPSRVLWKLPVGTFPAPPPSPLPPDTPCFHSVGAFQR